MRAYIESIARALNAPSRHAVIRVPRRMRPRTSRSTFVAVAPERRLPGRA